MLFDAIRCQSMFVCNYFKISNILRIFVIGCDFMQVGVIRFFRNYLKKNLNIEFPGH